MIALYRKELRQLWPVALLGFLLFSGDLFYRPFTEYLDQASWEEIASYVDPSEDGGFGFFVMVLAVATAYAAFPREHDERTIDFLLSLPVRPRAIFAAKAAAGLTLVALPTVGLAVTDGVMGSLSPESVGGGHWRASVALTHLGLHLAFVLIAYAHGLLASVLRLFGLIPYALLLVLASILEDLVPSAAWVDPTELLVARYEGRAPLVPWIPLAAPRGVAAGALGVGYAMWMGPAARIGRGLERLRASLVGKLVLGCGTVAAGATIVVAAVVVGALEEPGVDVDEPATGEPAPRPSVASAETRTERYLVTYPRSHAARALRLAADVDGLHAAVQARLGADRGPRLVADLTEVSGEHRGIASWTHVRVGLVTEPDEARLRHTFAHETTHAFQHRLSDRRQGTEARATRFFGEGSAEWVAYEVVPGPEPRAHARLMAAAAWERHGLRFEELVDDERLRARFDTTLVYSVGEVWADALVRTCGPTSIGDVLRAMARDGAPRDLEPARFWEDTLRAAGCDLERVNARFAATMDALVQTHRAEIDALPRIGGGVVGRDGGAHRVVARLDRPAPPHWEVVAFVRRGPDVGDSGVVALRGRADPARPGRYVVRVPRVLVGARRFQLRFAIRTDPDGWAWSETWQWVSGG